MKRNLKFWTRFTWETCGVELGLVAFVAVLTAFGAEQLQFQMLASVVPYYLFFAAGLCIMLVNMSAQMLYVPLLLSFGETRRNIYFGVHYYRCLVIAVSLALSSLIWALVPGEVSALGFQSIPTMLVVLVMTSSFGSLLSTLYVKWKWLATGLMVLIFGSIGALSGFFFSQGIKLEAATTLQIANFFTKLPWWLVLAAGILLALDVCFHWLLLRRQEVKL